MTKDIARPRILVLDYRSSAEARYVSYHGGTPVCCSPYAIDEVEAILDLPFDGLLLSGGGDIDPRLYGEKPHKHVYGVSEIRDYTEWLALDQAEKIGVPVLGICRGSQLMAVWNGGRLKQHLPGHRGNSHLVFTESGSRFRQIIGSQTGLFRSLHHQVVLRHGAGFQVAGRDLTGNIEAIESRDGRCLGVQFHPEMDHSQNECSRRIFRWLVHESAKRAGLPVPKPSVPGKTKAAVVKYEAPKKGRRTRNRNAVKTSWFCPDCGVRFDKQQDREDHITWIHGNPTITVTEPPPGHPDWMSSTATEWEQLRWLGLLDAEEASSAWEEES